MKSHTTCEGPLASGKRVNFGGADPIAGPPEKCAPTDASKQTTNKQTTQRVVYLFGAISASW